MCTSEEKFLEINLACMLDYVAQIATADRVVVPDMEDASFEPGYNRSASLVLKRFSAWYAGDEETNVRKGLGTPTLARVLVAERLERPLVDRDFAVSEALYCLPQFHSLQHKVESEVSLQSMDGDSEDDEDEIDAEDNKMIANQKEDLQSEDAFEKRRLKAYKRKDKAPISDYNFSALGMGL